MDIYAYALLMKKIKELEEGGGTGGSTTYQPFPSSWTTNSTTAALCEDIMADSNVKPAMAYMGEVTLTDKPFNGNAELIVEIMEGPASGPGKAIHLILTSGTDYPYHWEYTYWKTGGTAHSSDWIGFQPEGEGGGDANGIIPITEAPTTDNPDDDLKIVILEDEPIDKYNGYLYITSVNLITFNLYYYDQMANPVFVQMYAEDGMTWEEWCDSNYNYWFDNNYQNKIFNYWMFAEENHVYSKEDPNYYIDVNFLDENWDDQPDTVIHAGVSYPVVYDHGPL